MFGQGGGRGQTGLHVRFTVKGDALYAIVFEEGAAGREVFLTPLAARPPIEGRISQVTLLGAPGELTFTQEETGLRVALA